MWSVVTALISSDIRRLIEIRWSQLSCLPQLIYDKTNARNASWILMYYFHRKYHNNYIRNSREPQFSPSVFLLCAGKIFWKIFHGGFRAMGARRGDFWKIFLGRKIFQENCLEITQNWLNSPRRGRFFLEGGVQKSSVGKNVKKKHCFRRRHRWNLLRLKSTTT